MIMCLAPCIVHCNIWGGREVPWPSLEQANAMNSKVGGTMVIFDSLYRLGSGYFFLLASLKPKPGSCKGTGNPKERSLSTMERV